MHASFSSHSKPSLFRLSKESSKFLQCDFTISVRVKLLHQGVALLPAHGLAHLAQLGRGDEAGVVLVNRLECEDSAVEVLRLSLLINVFLFAKLRKASFSMNPDS